jgi:hypothetical protein
MTVDVNRWSARSTPGLAEHRAAQRGLRLRQGGAVGLSDPPSEKPAQQGPAKPQSICHALQFIMHTQHTTRPLNGRSFALPTNSGLPEDLRADLLHEKMEIERRLRAIDAVLNCLDDDSQQR